MSLSKVGTGASDDQNGTSQTTRTLTKDSGLANGDLIIISVPYYEDSSNAVVTVSGTTWTDHGPAILFEGTGTAESRLHIFSRVVDGSEGASFVASRTNQYFGTAMMVSLRGSSALSVASVNAGSPAAGVTSVSAPTVTLSATQGIVAIYGISDPPGTYTAPAGMTLGISEATDQSTTGRIYFESPAAGATGTRTLSWTTSRDAIGVMLVIEGANVSAANNLPRNILTLGAVKRAANF